MHYVKINTSDEEVRWINLDLVCRVTLATDTARGYPIMAIIFADGSVEDKLVITGSNPTNQAVIDDLAKRLDALSKSAVSA